MCLRSVGIAPDKLLEEIKIPDPFLDAFENYCQVFGLVDENGNFNDAYKLVEFFCTHSEKT